MFILTIYFADKSVRWVEYFNNIESANKWITEEQTRPYWDSSWTYDIVDNTPPPYIPSYKELRAKEYPPIVDYMDGIVKGDQEQIQNYINACLAVKAKYPKV